ncbi:Integrase, catalytic region [Cupriavidus taiwanensis]|uniref:Integrase, catalytic region n=2 Tax=Cupriavidus taiwanensis TaxID=164546 RepID=A0A375CQJ2_9BURK|nr:Integrase, catalytic region [Cupriavidus taiwanensis]
MRCAAAGATPPSRATISRRWAEHRDKECMKLSGAAPGHLVAKHPLDIVQIDHTLADIMLVDEVFRHTIGRPWLTLAIDVATRSVVAMYVGFDRPNAATVALLLTRMVLPKAPWLASREVAVDWPMHGMPKVLHLDNATEFKSKALQAGCNQYGIELMYRPPGRPYFGGHIERLNRTMMEKVHSLPGSTGASTKGRKARKPEREAALTLREFEQWLMYEIGQTYHHSAHRGLSGATPYSAWSTLSEASKPRLLPDSVAEELRFLIRFLPMSRRTIQADGLTLFYLHYWHPIFTAWRAANRRVVVRYHPEDLSRIFVSTDGKEYVEASFADLRRGRISLWEQKAVLKHLRSQGESHITESAIFNAIAAQRSIIAEATTKRRSADRRGRAGEASPFPSRGEASQQTNSSDASSSTPEVDYSKPAPSYHVEQL